MAERTEEDKNKFNEFINSKSCPLRHSTRHLLIHLFNLGDGAIRTQQELADELYIGQACIGVCLKKLYEESYIWIEKIFEGKFNNPKTKYYINLGKIVNKELRE